MTYFILSLLPLLTLTFFKTKKSFHMLQQNWYNDDQRYFKWLIKNPFKVFITPDAFFFTLIVGLFLDKYLLMIIFALFYIIVGYLYRKSMKKEQTKKPLVFTKRVRRLTYTTIVLYLIAIIGICLLYDETDLAYYYLFIGFITYINYFVVMASNFINKPWEKQVFYYYKRKAKKKLKSMTNMKVIGITGSYGKTSTKNIVSDILNVKYDAFPTPKNFNTTYGLMITINNHLDKFSEYFIAEMGAFKRGEIKELCDFVHPTYGILTTIGTAHLDSFGSRENIQKGKFELIESLPKNGVAVLNRDDEWQVSYKLKNTCKTLWIGIDNKETDVYATNIKLTKDGTKFDCVFKGDNKKYPFETKLLGKTNVYNILGGIMLGYHLGMSIEELQLGVLKVKPVEHRLELKKYLDINIIDDAYNSNPVGAKMALEVLNMMPGKKIIVTPGMIELKDKEYELNLEFGKQIADVADEVILIGAEQTKPIHEGLELKDYKDKNIHILNDVKEAFPLMQKLKDKETYVLLENDLPDLFNEK
ncbi:MAG: UDP-N-acetylmuramoyl-tripeptide--D-alanyl-D-alanine ligase [Bacilli bacterium]|nr:UDP-N-acetylmuramoyl-tripeptide--D-alanyl-D-alanine ligase [Bacilli bacterium]